MIKSLPYCITIDKQEGKTFHAGKDLPCIVFIFIRETEKEKLLLPSGWQSVPQDTDCGF